MKPGVRTALIVSLTIACSDGTGPSDRVTIQVCSNIGWVGVGVDGGAMRTIPPGGRSFRRMDRVVAGTLTGGGIVTPLHLYYVTAEQLAATLACPGSKFTVNGSVVLSGQSGLVTISTPGASTSATAFVPGFTLNLPEPDAFDLVATLSATHQTIIRRNQVFANGATIPPLDFTLQGFIPDSHRVTVTGGTPQQFFSSSSAILTKGGATGFLGGSNGFVAGTDLPIFTAPDSALSDGDLHFVRVVTENVRGVDVFTRTPAGKSIAFGPQPNLATLSNGMISLASQTEYGSYIHLLICRPQPSPPPVLAYVTATREYFGGTPITWSLPLPDLPSVQGFPGHPDVRSWGPCQREVYGQPYRFQARMAREGDVHRFAAMTQ